MNARGYSPPVMPDRETQQDSSAALKVPGDYGWGRWVWLAYLLFYPVPWYWRPPTTTGLVVSAIAVAFFIWLYTQHFYATGRKLIAVSLITLAVSFALAPFGGAWGTFTIYAAAIGANLRPTRQAVKLLVFICAALLLFAWIRQLHWSEWAFTLFMGVMVGASSILFAQLQESNRQLAESRESARHLAVVAERERIARDLHDLLGHTLTVVAVKADLAAKLVQRDANRAAAEIEDIRTTTRAALADIRAAVTGMRSTTLAAEIAQARYALAAAGVTFNYEGGATPLPENVESTLAFLIREGVTNVVRHAGASRCDIRLEHSGDSVVLEVADDGRGTSAREGNGVLGMRARVAQLAGVFSLTSERGTKLRAQIPLAASTA